MPAISVMIKPASGLCNMRCRYCFYADETENREVKSYGIMQREVLEPMLQRILAFATGECTIAFQGGEPTLAGLDFYRQVVELQKKHNTKGLVIHNAIQTNGYVINDEWAAFFAENHFLVGLSLDGTKDLHDLNRPDAEGKGTFSRVMHAAQLFDKHKVEYNILTVITADTARSIRKIYGFFDRNHFAYQQYIPCLDPIGEERGQHPYSLTPPLFEQYLKNAFDLWYQDFKRGRPKYHRYFENLLMLLAGQQPESCGVMGVCSHQFVVEADGSVYPCDFYVLDEWRLGNLATDSFEQIEAKRAELGFVQMSRYVDESCKGCKWFGLCRGGCRRDREPVVDGHLSKNYFCQAYYNFFEYAAPRLQEVLYTLQARGR